MERKTKTGSYDMTSYSVELTDVDVPAKPGESVADHENRMHYEVYKKMLAYDVFHGTLTIEQAKQELARYKRTYNVGAKPATEATG